MLRESPSQIPHAEVNSAQPRVLQRCAVEPRELVVQRRERRVAAPLLLVHLHQLARGLQRQLPLLALVQ